MHMSTDAERSFVKDLAGGDEDDDPVLLSSVSLREHTTLTPVRDTSPPANSPSKRPLSLSDSDHQQENKEEKDTSSNSNHKKEIETFEVEEAIKLRPQRPTILKRSKHPIRVSTTYVSNTNSNQPTSPTGSNSSAHTSQNKGCCTIL